MPISANGASAQSATVSSFSKSTTSISVRKKPFLFISNLWRRKKVLEIDDLIFDRELNQRTRSEPSVISYSCTQMGAPKTSSPSISALTMTPGRMLTKDLDQDMQAIRMSRQDNPFVQKVIASRESLIDTLEDDTVSDDAILIQDFNGDCDSDPFTLPEVQEHMIRSPPPTSWPRSPHSIFQFGGPHNPQVEHNLTVSSISSDEETIGGGNCKKYERKIGAQDLFAGTHNWQQSSGPSDYISNHSVMARPSSSLSSGSSSGIQMQNVTVNSSVPRPKCLYDGPLSIRNFK